MENQGIANRRPLAVGDLLHQFLLDCVGPAGVRQSRAVADTQPMGIHRDSRLGKGITQYQIGGFPPTPGRVVSASRLSGTLLW
jgi:hypothetical protein